MPHKAMAYEIKYVRGHFHTLRQRLLKRSESDAGWGDMLVSRYPMDIWPYPKRECLGGTY